MNKYSLYFAIALTFSAHNAYSSACQTFVDNKTYDAASNCLNEMTEAGKQKYGDTRSIPAGKMLAALKALGVAVRNKNNFNINSNNAILRTRDYLESDEAKATTAAATAGPAATAGGAENVELTKFNRLTDGLEGRLETYSGGDKAAIKDQIGLVRRSVTRVCTDQNSEACNNALNNSRQPLTVLTKKIMGQQGAAAAATPVAAKKTATVKRVGPTLGGHRKKASVQ